MAPSQRLQQVSGHLALATDPTRIDGQVVLITGGAQGIGRATAELLAGKGAKILINDLDGAKAIEAVESLKSAGSEAAYVIGNLLDTSVPEKLVKATLERYGKINILVNNAGFCFDDPIHKMSEEKFDIIMKIHNYVPFRMAKALYAHWRDPANLDMPKTIINISSVSGLHGAIGQINYATAKAGINGMTMAIAKEWSRFNVRCNSVAYGWIDTRITRPPDENEKFEVDGQQIQSGMPLTYQKWRDTSDILIGRPGTIQEAAGVMLFLASPLSSYVTGACIECTGGRYL